MNWVEPVSKLRLRPDLGVAGLLRILIVRPEMRIFFVRYGGRPI
jgi:hypothetical protein